MWVKNVGELIAELSCCNPDTPVRLADGAVMMVADNFDEIIITDEDDEGFKYGEVEEQE